MLHDRLRTVDRPEPGTGSAATSTDQLARLLDDEIARYRQTGRRPLRAMAPWFPPVLEDKFDADTCKVRVRDLRFTMIVGTVFYFLSAVTDPVFVPDLGWNGLLLRLIPLPFMLLAIIVGTRLRSPFREQLVAATTVLIVGQLAVIPVFSDSPLAPFAFASAMLALVYTNTTLVLRFPKACVTTAISGMIIVVAAVLREGASDPLGWAIALQAVIAALFSLVANHRIEWSSRLGYLLTTREAMRVQAVTADREVFKTLSCTDALTGLANRGALNRWCASAFSTSESHGLPATLLMIDVDHFKRYNDHYGHIAGDACLRAIAERVSQTVRGHNDTVARYGGEEFVVLSLNVTPAQAWGLADRICTAVSDMSLEHLDRGDQLAHVTISVGIATTTIGPGTSLDGLIDAADRGLYAAKRNGRNRVEGAMPSAA
jgi:diguanylate cyclase (GGDEF)-like protein